MEDTSAELLRAIRGKRSQVAFARRLGYRGNPMTDWENGRRFPTAAEALRACARARIDVRAAFARFHAAEPPTPPERVGEGGDEVARWLGQARGSTPISTIAERTGRSRFAVARFLRGESEPRLPDFLRLVDAITGRLPDLVAELVPIEEVPSLLPRYRIAAAAKRLAFEEPWTEAVLRLLETTAYQALPAHDDAWIGKQLAIETADAKRCVKRLAETGIVEDDGKRYRVSGTLSVDTRADPAALRGLLSHWSQTALARYGRGAGEDLFAYNVISVSQADLTRVRELLRSTFREVRAIVAASEPSELAAVLNVQLVVLEEPRKRAP